MAAKLSGWVLLADLDMSDQGSWNAFLSHPTAGVGCETSGDGGTSTGQNSGCGILGEDETSQGWSSACAWCRDPSGATPSWFPKRIHAAPDLSELRQEEAPGTCDHHTRTIAYPIRMCCPDGWLKRTSLATTFRQPAYTPCILVLLMAKDFKASVLHVSELSIALPWIPKNSPQSWICFGDKKNYQNTKT